jgi:hypothetical protein
VTALEAVLVAVGVVLVGVYVSWTAGRLDRLHARVDASWAALDAQLVRRAAAARALVPLLGERTAARLDAAAHDALEGDEQGREAAENALTRVLRIALTELPPDADLAELDSAAARVGLARTLHNGAVEATRAMRFRRLPRLLRLAGRRRMPTFFEIDDTALDGRTAPRSP